MRTIVGDAAVQGSELQPGGGDGFGRHLNVDEGRRRGKARKDAHCILRTHFMFGESVVIMYFNLSCGKYLGFLWHYLLS